MHSGRLKVLITAPVERNINRVTTCYTLDIEFLTCGNDNLTYEQNCIIFKYVFDYIKCPKRFLIV